MKLILLGLGLFCLLAISLGLHLALEQARRVTALSVPTTATVLEKRLKTHSGMGRGTRRHRDASSSVTYEPVVKYQYEVQGRQFTSNAIFPDTFQIGGNLGRVAARAPLDHFEIGQQTRAYYNPDDPAEACLIRRPLVLPYTLVLLPMIVLSGLVVVWPTSLRGKAEAKRWKARGIAVMWHTLGLAAAGHYFIVAGSNYSGAALALLGLYTQLGLVPLLINAGPDKPSAFVSRVQSAITGSLFGTFIGFWLGMAIGLAAMALSASPTFVLKCWGFTPAIMAGLFALLSLTGDSSGKRPASKSKGSRPSRRRRSGRQPSAAKRPSSVPQPPPAGSIPYALDQRPLPDGEDLETLLPAQVGPFHRWSIDDPDEVRNVQIYAQYRSDHGEIFVELGICDGPAEAQRGIKTAKAETDAEFPEAAQQLSLDTEPSFFKTSTRRGALMAWTRGHYFFLVHARGGEQALGRFLEAFPY